MVKIILGIIIVILVGYIGYGIEKFYKTRLNIIEEYKRFVAYSERETTFLKTNIHELIKNFEFTYQELIRIINSSLNNEQIKDCIYITDNFKQAVNTFINEISKCDFYSIKSVFNKANQECDEIIIKAQKDKVQKGELARKLVILAGIGLIIVII